MLKLGMKGTCRMMVTETTTAKAVGSGTLDVLATPMMIALMEKCAWTSVADALENGNGTVGTLMNVKHLSPTPVGMEITCKSELIEVEDRRLVFHVTASDENGVIGEGTHERFIISEKKFQSKANQKI